MEMISGDDCFKLLDEKKYILFYFTASWCGPCQRVYPHFTKLMESYDPNVIIARKIDIDDDDNSELCSKLKVTSVPTFVLLKDRTYIDRCVGGNIEKIQDMIEKNVVITQEEVQEEEVQEEIVVNKNLEQLEKELKELEDKM